mmetsp:Transcript_11881/g.16455  ORF Transcript_11881/g.16455 Transcript_11881/m.16455 type:complete len:198 (-) Transcript_11881:148-741(-)
MLVRRQTKMLQDIKASRKRWVARTIRLAAWMMKKKERMDTAEPFEGRWANSPNLRDEIGSGNSGKNQHQIQVRKISASSMTPFKPGGKEGKIMRPEIKKSLNADPTSQKHTRKVSPVDIFVEKLLYKRMATKQGQNGRASSDRSKHTREDELAAASIAMVAEIDVLQEKVRKARNEARIAFEELSKSRLLRLLSNKS